MDQPWSVRSVRCGAGLCLSSWMLASCIDAPAPPPPTGGEPENQVGSQIVNGWDATGAYPEFVGLTFDGFACSAVLLAPQLALTAGHCHGTNMEIYRNGIPHIPAGRVAWWGMGPPDSDFALVELTQPVFLGRYPALGADLAVGTPIAQVGRIHDGQITDNGWGMSGQTVAALQDSPPYYFLSRDDVEHGDSGGPNFVDGTHILVGVNSFISAGGSGQSWLGAGWADLIAATASSWGYSINVIHAKHLQSAFDGRVLDNTGWSKDWGSLVQQWDYSGQANQMWYVTTGLNSDNWNGAEIRNLYSNLCLDVRGGSSSNGLKMEQWGCNGGDPQAWNFVNNAVQSVASRKCLDVPNWDPSNGVQIQQWDCTGQSNQTWWVW